MNPNLLRQIGSTSLNVSQFGFGGAGIGSIFRKVSQAQADDAIQRAYDAGVRYFDTAPLYGYGLSEGRLGHAIQNIPRDHITLSTKVGYTLIPARRTMRQRVRILPIPCRLPTCLIIRMTLFSVPSKRVSYASAPTTLILC